MARCRPSRPNKPALGRRVVTDASPLLMHSTREASLKVYLLSLAAGLLVGVIYA